MEKVRRELRRLAFGKANDCVKLALNEYEDLGKLDLSMLTEIKKSEKGVEVKMLDRTKILALLADLPEKDGENPAASALLKVLQQEDDDG